MNTTNKFHIPLPRVRELFESTIGGFETRFENGTARELNYALYHQSPDFKIIHPLFIGKYARIMKHHRDKPLSLVGFDIETEHTTGHPMLFGFSYADGDTYFSIHRPNLDKFYSVIKNLIDNAPGTNLVTWGNLDLQEVIRIFEPDGTEQEFISRGYAGRYDKHAKEWIAVPPCIRTAENGDEFFIDHYISGRSLRLGIISDGHARSIWIFNVSQFYPATIAQTATALNLPWKEFSKETHLIDWERFESDSDYYRECIESNKQDARIVRALADNLADIFNRVFGAYPSLLVSAGSLADAAVSKLLSDDDYASNSWRWISSANYHFRTNHEAVRKAETLLSEAFSAGYVDQFALGYFPEVHIADISSAYPHKIRRLPDLRQCELFNGEGNPKHEINSLRARGYAVFTAVIRGHVTIPETLKYHPITIRTHKRQNIRPSGSFYAAYYLEERDYCVQHGAKFEDEEYVIFAFRSERLAPIANVSTMLRGLREKYIATRDEFKPDSDDYLVYDGMQYMIKVVDNSLYGKTVMTSPIIENVDDHVEITGFKGGDRYNMLYGGVITARTRIQLAEACTAIESNGGQPLLAMTDSVTWKGSPDMLPERFRRDGKVPGYFEQPETYYDFYLLKTGQYEYRISKGDNSKWEHKMRGLNLPFDRRSDSESFYRKTLIEFCATLDANEHPKDIEIPLPVRRLVTIGAYDISRLGLVEDSINNLKPFVLSGKNTGQRYVFNWKDTLNGNIKLKQPIVVNGESPLAYLRELYENGKEHLTRYEKKQLFYWECVLRIASGNDPKEFERIYLKKRLTEHSFAELEEWFGVTRKQLKI